MKVEPTGTNTVVTGAIRQAARMTGADFRYLLATAQVESSLNPDAKVSTSSAQGLFQFIGQTWLTTLKEQGPALGYGPYANAIARQPSGEYAITDPRMTNSIMNLRADPTANALMAGAFTKANAGKLAERLGRNPTEGELYIAHFLGAAGAGRLIELADSKSQTAAAPLFPGPARANPTIFYDGQGSARSVSQVYRNLIGRYDVARGGTAHVAATPVMASAPVPVPPAMVPNAGVPARVSFAPDTAAMTETFAAAAKLSSPPAQAELRPVFHGLFRTTEGQEPVAPAISALWSAPKPQTSQPPQQASAAPPQAPPSGSASNDLGLFQDQAPDARALFRGRV